MQTIYLILVICLCITCQAAYEDSRCKCVCVDHSVPKTLNETSTEPTRTVYVKSIPADKCSCQIMLDDKSELCPYCDCKYQVRNTSTIKIVVCLIVVIIASLSLYLIFMLLLEPFLSARGRKITFGAATPSTFGPSSSVVLAPSKALRQVRNYTMSPDVSKFQPKSHSTDYNTMPDNAELDDSEGARERGDNGNRGVSSVVNRAQEQQNRWKGKLQEQRDRVFNKRTILN